MLLIDDDAFLRDMYAMKFSESGYDVDVAENGADGLRKLHTDAVYNVMLLDMVMPGMSGLEFIEKIKTELPQLETKIIVLSNQGEKEDVEEALSAGAVGYIVKAESVPSEVVTKVNDFCKL